MKPHKHAELIKAWADGAEIEVKNEDGTWELTNPIWHPNNIYRIKPEEKKPVVRWLWMTQRQEGWMISSYFASDEEVKSENSPYAWVKLDWSRTEFEE